MRHPTPCYITTKLRATIACQYSVCACGRCNIVVLPSQLPRKWCYPRFAWVPVVLCSFDKKVPRFRSMKTLPMVQVPLSVPGKAVSDRSGFWFQPDLWAIPLRSRQTATCLTSRKRRDCESACTLRFPKGTSKDNSQNVMQLRQRLLSFWLVTSRWLDSTLVTRLCKILSFRRCWLAIVVVWWSLWVSQWSLNDGQVGKASFHDCYRFGASGGWIGTLESRSFVTAVASCAVHRVFGEGVKAARGETAILGRGDHTLNMCHSSSTIASCCVAWTIARTIAKANHYFSDTLCGIHPFSEHPSSEVL